VIVALVAAVARGGVIGSDGRIPWRLPEDMARFRELTMGHPVVMGRRTWESLPDQFRPLPGRGNVVVSRNRDWSAQGADRVGSIEDALALLADEPHVFVIGGGEIYAAALPYADELLLTEIDADVDGDTTFPSWEPDQFEETVREPRRTESGTPFAFVTYRRTLAGRQLRALGDVTASLDAAALEHWLFGGWAVDFHAGRITRPHFDVDIAVWLADLPRIDGVLLDAGWAHAPDPEDDGGTGYERGGIRLELTYLVRAEDGRVVTPLREAEAAWPEGAFGAEERELHGVHVPILGLEALTSGKSAPRDETEDADKDRADHDVLSDLSDDG